MRLPALYQHGSWLAGKQGLKGEDIEWGKFQISLDRICFGFRYSDLGNPSVSGVFIPLWQRGIKGDFRIMLVKSPLAPLFQRGV